MNTYLNYLETEYTRLENLQKEDYKAWIKEDLLYLSYLIDKEKSKKVLNSD